MELLARTALAVSPLLLPPSVRLLLSQGSHSKAALARIKLSMERQSSLAIVLKWSDLSQLLDLTFFMMRPLNAAAMRS
jgi:hypothetical protein